MVNLCTELYLILSIQSFFTIYRNLFSRLAHDESLISDTSYPSFGSSTWPWTAATKTTGDESAKVFYSSWINFSTAKEFTWMDRYNLSDAPDRRNRRLDLLRCDPPFFCAQIVSDC
jgi:DnaJ homolog subfamily A member 5